MPRRSLLEIYTSILEVVSDGISKPTRIMYSSNLSWLPLQRHLDTLLQKKFLTERQVEKRKIYEITENGRRFLYHTQIVRNELTIDDTDLKEDAVFEEADNKVVRRPK